MKLKNLLLVFGSCLTLSSCLTQKKIDEICSRCPVIRKDSIIEKVIHDTIALPPIQGATVYKDSPCDSLGRLKPFEVTGSKNGIKTTVKSVGNTIVGESEAYNLKVPVTHKETSSFQKETKIIYKCEKEHRTKFDGFTFWFFWIVSGLVALSLLGHAVKKYLLK